ncbi:MAG: WecB/TagA/CpsF family glycosyltransferase [Clostridiales bacterium]|nr:WecB/TagA/CpsF family glycosyltransferase [Clostridiales bacterium]
MQNSMPKVDILNIPITNATLQQALNFSMDALGDATSKTTIFTPNPEIIWLANNNAELNHALQEADILIPDGIGVVIASKILKNPLQERVAGFDLLCEILKNSAKKSYKVFLLGGRPGVASRARENLQRKYTNIKIVGTCNGYFNAEQDAEIIDKINNSGADFLAVALGAPKQELWITKYRAQLKPRLCIGVGGALDVIAGSVKRAPKLWQRAGLEWLYRLLKEPKRLPRMMSIPKFLLKVMLSPKNKKQPEKQELPQQNTPEQNDKTETKVG